MTTFPDLTAFPEFRGTLVSSRHECGVYAADFGGLVSETPTAVLRPHDGDDLVSLMRFASAQQLRVCARGQGHTTRGQAQLEAGVLVDMRALNRVRWPGGDEVEVEAGATWRSLVDVCEPLGLTPPTLTDYLGLSVGGTLSVGGVGSQSFRHGMQVDNVSELTVVTGDGVLRKCSRQQSPDLFDAVRGGLGRFGIVVSAKLRLLVAPQWVHAVTLGFRTLAELLDAFELLEQRFDQLCAFASPQEHTGWRFSVQAATHDSEPELEGLTVLDPPQRFSYFDFLRRVDPIVEAMLEHGRWQAPHPWCDMFLPSTRAREIAELATDLLDAQDLGGGDLMIYPLKREHCTAPLLRLPNEARCVLFDILATASSGHPERLAIHEAKCERIVRRALQLGATVYPIGYPLGTEHMSWSEHFGDQWQQYRELRARFDPAGILGANSTLG